MTGPTAIFLLLAFALALSVSMRRALAGTTQSGWGP
jgi:hypothetical protein